MAIIDEYIDGTTRGWPEEGAAEEFAAIRDAHNFVQNRLILEPGRARKSSNYKAVRKALGDKDIKNIPQEVGDCVSWGARNAAAVTGCIDIAIRNESEIWKDPFPPYYYGTSRVQIGKGKLGGGDGSYGSWMAAAVIAYGTIYFGEDKVPPYSGSIARAWGKSGPPAGMLDVGKNFLIRSAVEIKSWEDAVTYSVNGYGMTVASNYGFSMLPDAKGFNQQSGRWGHQMCILDIDDEWPEPYAIILNSWGNVHGKLYDFHDKTQLPAGCLRITRKSLEGMISSGEVFAFCQYDQPKSQDVDASLFKLWNNPK